jgi:hypothetical protein
LEIEIRIPRNKITTVKRIFIHFNFIRIRRIVGGITSIVTMVMIYLVDRIGCETNEIIVTTTIVPKKILSDSHKTNRYSENDFLKLRKNVSTIRP